MFLKAFFSKAYYAVTATGTTTAKKEVKHRFTEKEYKSKKTIERYYISKRNKAKQGLIRQQPKQQPSSRIVPSKFRLTNTEAPKPKMKGLPFAKLPIHPSLIEALNSSDTLPSLSTPFQSEAICRLVTGQENKFLLASETGSGKTLSYLLPLLTLVKESDVIGNNSSNSNDNDNNNNNNDITKQSDNSNSRNTKATPRALIILPSNELVEQVYKLAKFFSHYIKLRISKLSASQTPQQRRRVKSFSGHSGGVDVLITTPRQYLVAKNSDPTPLEIIKRSSKTPLLDDGSLEYLVVDEADTLLSDDDFGASIREIIAGKDLFIVAVSATVPVTLTKFMDTLLLGSNEGGGEGDNHYKNNKGNNKTDNKNKVVKIESPDLHTVSKNLKCRFIKTFLAAREKKRFLEELLLRNKEKKTIIFCNKTSVAIDLHHHITSNDSLLAALGTIPILLHGSMREGERFDLLGKFINSQARMLITTDLSSRGLDTQDVNHVVLYEFPRSSIEFLHRIGRTSRLSGRRHVAKKNIDDDDNDDDSKDDDDGNIVSCFINKKNLRLANRIENSIKNGLKLSYNDV